MKWPNPPLEVLVIAHVAAFSLAATAGAFHGPILAEPRTAGPLLEEFHRIGTHNIRALVLLVATNIPLVGSAGLFLFLLNGYLFGRMLAGSAAPTVWVWLYAPLEVGAFALGASASMRIGLAIVRWLAGNEGPDRPALEESTAAVAVAFGGIGLAALLEAAAILKAWGTG